jgi:outer membrane immunogenic protein
MLRRIAFTAVSVIALAGGANAQNYAAVNWSGLYGGVNAGYGSGGSSNLFVEDQANWAYTVKNAQGQVIASGSGTDYASLKKSFDSSGGFGGGQIGYNTQRGNIVFGVEGDLQGSGITGSGAGTLNLTLSDPYNNSTFTSKVSAKSELDYFGTFRGRVGYTVGNALVYFTGGLAFGGVNDNLTFTDDTGTKHSKSNSSTLTGYVLGGGAEYFLNPSWSVKAEYQYIDLGQTDLKLDGYYLGNDAKATADHTYNTVRAGINYHVGAGIEPLK